jgi:alkanesulfonate monooxygenase SsuD/methylene tetrahydromethanopterin reductase-like flavin-dependent oxidoreductase (luciferase family)
MGPTCADAQRREQRPVMHLGVDLGGAGCHPAAWREPDAQAERLFAAERVVGLAQEAESAGFDFLTLGDGFGLQAVGADRVRGRLDALLVLARVAPATRIIGLVAMVTTTHTEPFHVSKNLATLDLVSHGRAGWRVAVSTTPAEADLFGRKPPADLSELLDEADDAIEVVTRLWDSWEDDAVIRDVATGRYIDRSRLHYVDFEGRFFRVRGPSITPRPPQGQVPIFVDAVTGSDDQGLLGGRPDVVIVPAGEIDRRRAVAPIVVAELSFLLGPTTAAARAEHERLDTLAGETTAIDFVGAAADLSALLEAGHGDGRVDGFLLRPALLPRGLAGLAGEVLPELRRRGVLHDAPTGRTLREHLGLPRPANRYTVSR